MDLDFIVLLRVIALFSVWRLKSTRSQKLYFKGQATIFQQDNASTHTAKKVQKDQGPCPALATAPT